MFFLTLNFGLSLAVFLHLWQYRRSRRRDVVEHIIFSEPVFPEKVSFLLYRGAILWCVSFLFTFFEDVAWCRDLELAFFTAATMYLVHGLTHLTAYPLREGGIPPNLHRIESLRTISLIVLVVITVFALAADVAQRELIGDDKAKALSVAFLYPLWLLAIFVNIWWNLRYSDHPLRRSVMVILGSGTLYAFTCLVSRDGTGLHILQTVMLAAMLVALNRTALLHINSAFKLTDFARREKNVVISFLSTITEEGHASQEERPQSAIGTLDLDFLLRTTLRFAMELTEAGAGAIFMLDSDEEAGRLKWQRDELIPRAVNGLYPPHTDITRLLHVSMRQKYLNDLLLAERHPVGLGLEGMVAERGESLLIPNALEDPRVLQQVEDFLKVRNALAVPLKVQDDVVGVVCVVNRRGDHPFTIEHQNLLEAMSEQAAITLGTAIMHHELQEKERLEREIELAHEVQRLLLPTSCPKIPGYGLAAFSESAQQVGGDYFDFVHHPSGELTIVVADVSGKGVPAALTMAMVRSALRALGPMASGPKDLLVQINRFIAEDLRRDMFISMLAVTLAPGERRLRVARAGHDPLLQIFENGAPPNQLTPDGIALGLVRNEQFEEFTEEIEIEMHAGERYALYTDGVTEAMNDDGEEFTLDRLLEDLHNTMRQTPEQAISSVRDQVAGFVKTAPQHDDITLLVLDVLKGG